ncbi:hypothetical protein ACVWZ4_004366 [Bradyrhizobium sp. USDA 4472]
MSEAMRLIVAGYVKMQDGHALEALRDARRKVLRDLQSVTGMNTAKLIETVEGDLAEVEAGLEQLKSPPGALSDNERSEPSA